MNQRNSLRAKVDEFNHSLEEIRTLAYYQERLPSKLDFQLDTNVQEFVNAGPAQAQACQALLTDHTKAILGLYGHRAATRAARDENSDLLRLGLAAAVIAKNTVPEIRRLEVSLAVYHHVACHLGLDPAETFRDASALAEPDLADQFVAFGRREGPVLSQYGWKEINTQDGIRYKFSWG